MNKHKPVKRKHAICCITITAYCVNIELMITRKSLREVQDTEQKIKISIKGFVSKCDQISRKLQIWSHLLKEFLTENLMFYTVGEAIERVCALRSNGNPKFFFRSKFLNVQLKKSSFNH